MTKDRDISDELRHIGELISSARLLQVIRTEVHLACKNQRIVVMDGLHGERHAEGSRRYDVVVVNKDDKGVEVVARRLRAKMPDVQIDKLVDNVLGIRTTRRGKLR